MKIRLVILACTLSLLVAGQVNLVPNPSFEVLDSCPYTEEQTHFASPWEDLSNSPDLYNTCAVSYSNSVPANWLGFQEPRTGNGYVGISAYNYYNGSNNEMRDIIGVPLTNQLVAGRKYCVEFYVSKANYSYYAINRIGAYFSPVIMQNDGQGDTIDVTPQIQLDTNSFLLDTANWVRVHGVHTAVGNEIYLAIGNFYSDIETDTVGQLGSNISGYIYIDDVAVYELQICEAGSNVSICYKDSSQLGSTSRPGVTYSWTPSTGLNSASISDPKASPEITTTYSLTQTECDAVLHDSVTITVNQDCHTAPTIIIPSLMVGAQEFFIYGLESNSRLELYDIRGRLIYRSDP